MSKLSWKDVKKDFERSGRIIRGGDDEVDIKPVLAGGDDADTFEKKKKYVDGYYNFKFGEDDDDKWDTPDVTTDEYDDDSPFRTNGLPNNDQGYLIEEPLTYAEAVQRICDEKGLTPAAVMYDQFIGGEDPDDVIIELEDDEDYRLDMNDLRELAKKNRGNTKRRH